MPTIPQKQQSGGDKTLGIEYETSIVINCPVCHRTIWRGTLCLHGQIPPPKAPTDRKEVPPYKPKTRDKRRPIDKEEEHGGEG